MSPRTIQLTIPTLLYQTMVNFDAANYILSFEHQREAHVTALMTT